MKIGFLMYDTILTGGTRVLFEVGRGLSKKGHKVIYMCLHFHDPRVWFDFGKNVDFVFPEKKYTLMIPLRGRITLRGLINRGKENWFPYDLETDRLLAESVPEDLDALFATYCFTAFSAHRSGIGIPFYYMQHYESLFFNDKYLKKKADETYFLPLNRISNSSWLKKTIKEKFGVDSLGPLIPGVDNSVFRPSDDESDSIGVPKIVALGKSTVWKGIDDLFKALELIRKNKKIELILYGSEPSLASRSPVPCKYVLKPTEAELAKLYSKASAVVTPSWYESSPLVPLEAMACGAPVVTTRIGTEDYCFDNENSLVVSPRDPKSLAEAILRIINEESLAESIKKNGIKTARQFTWEKTVNELESIIYKIKNKI